jgi:hypothetical protein
MVTATRFGVPAKHDKQAISAGASARYRLASRLEGASPEQPTPRTVLENPVTGVKIFTVPRKGYPVRLTK